MAVDNAAAGSVADLYFTVTFGYFFLNPLRTALKDSPSAPVQTATIVTVPLTAVLAAGAFLLAVPILAATSTPSTATTPTSANANFLINPLLSSPRRSRPRSRGRR